jgi:hypothetical protein
VHPIAPPAPPLKPGAIDRSKLTTSFTIEKSIPLPAVKFGRIFECRWPFKQIAVDDSFSVPVPDGGNAQALAALLRSDVGRYDRLFPSFYAAIRIAEDRQSVRLWRTAQKESRFGRVGGTLPEAPKGNGAARDSKGLRTRVKAKALL